MAYDKNTPHPYKGIPKAEWPGVRDKLAQERLAAQEQAARDAQAAEEAKAVEAQKARAEARQAAIAGMPSPPPRNLFSGDIKKLEVFGLNGDNKDPIPGFRLYWFLDRENSGARMHQARMSGWEYVMKDEVSVNDTSAIQGNSDLGSQVRVFGGSFNNQPIYHYLMKKPVWLDQVHQGEMQAHLDKVEGHLRRGKLDAKPEDRQYTAEEMPGSALPPISITHTRR